MTNECTKLDLIVIPAPSGQGKTVSVEPEFMINLKDQRVKVGQALAYTPGVQLNGYGLLMDVSVFLGDAFRFTTYEKDGNLFKVHSNLVLPSDVG